MSEISLRTQDCPGSGLLFVMGEDGQSTGLPWQLRLSVLYVLCPVCKVHMRADPVEGTDQWELEPHCVWLPVTDPTIIEMVCDADYCAGTGHELDLMTGEGPLRKHFLIRP